jgi:hypothetical protein
VRSSPSIIEDPAAGLVGINQNGGTISQSYSTGNASTAGLGATGGLVAVGSAAQVTSSYWDTQASRLRASPGGGTGLATSQFLSGILPSGFDSSIWTATPGQYPTLNGVGGQRLSNPAFTDRVSNSWHDDGASSGNLIVRFFAPNLSPLNDLHALAQLSGFDHFNIEQDIVDIQGARLLSRGTGIDPQLGGNSVLQVADSYPWYYDEIQNPDSTTFYILDPRITTSNYLTWFDKPDINIVNAGAKIQFIDYLVGVYSDHTGVRISDVYPDVQNVNFRWDFTQGLWGGSSGDLQYFDGFGLPDSGSQGSINFLGYFGNDPNVLSPVSAPVPEPCSMLILVSGLVLLCGIQIVMRAEHTD